MKPSNWLPWLPFSPQTPHSNEVEGRITRLEVFQEQQESHNDRVTERMQWLERGLQAIAVILLIIITKQAPSNAAGLAEALLAIIKR